MRRFRFSASKLRITAALLALGGAVIGVLGLSSGASAVPTGTSQNQVRNAFVLAMRVHQGIQVPLVAHSGDRPTAAQFNRQSADGNAAVHSIFADKVARREIAALDNAVTSEQQQQANFRVLGGGIGAVKFEKVTVQGTTASVYAAVDAWSRTDVKGPDGQWHVNEPHNVLDVTMTLARDHTSHWIVQTFDWQFAPGSEP